MQFTEEEGIEISFVDNALQNIFTDNHQRNFQRNIIEWLSDTALQQNEQNNSKKRTFSKMITKKINNLSTSI